VQTSHNPVHKYYTVPKNVTTLSRRNFDIHEPVLIIIGTNVTEEVGNQKLLHFPGEMKKDKNSVLSLKCCTAALPDLNQLLA